MFVPYVIWNFIGFIILLIELHPYFCNIVVKHDLSAKYSNNRNIEVIDNQKVITYKILEDLKEENIESTANKTVTYNLKKDSSNNYYLDTVIVQ